MPLHCDDVIKDLHPISATAAMIRAMSCGRDSRWSPSWIMVSTTSSRRQPLRQREGMLPGHIRILPALQDAHRAADIDRLPSSR